jgi:hypothetical protein
VGKKGDRASKEVQARQMYAYGLSLTDIAVALDISVTSLARWKSDTKDPNRQEDEWELARLGRRDHIDTIKATYQEQLNYVAGLSPRDRSPKDTDMLVKLNSVILSWEKFELEKVAKLMMRIERTPAPALEEPPEENTEPKVDPMEEIKRVYYG